MLAARQLDDYRRGTPGTIFARGLQLSEADAYRLQARVARLREQDGESVIGYKVGCTSREIQRQLGIDQPIGGRLFATEQHISPVSLSISDYDSLAIEGELAVQLAEDITDPRMANSDLIRSVGAIFPVIELHNYVFHSGAPSAAELIANNGMHAGFVMPANVHTGLPEDEPGLTIAIDGRIMAEQKHTGAFEAVTRSLRWLAAELNRQGVPLHADQIVLTGSRAPLFPVATATTVTVSAPPYREVRAQMLPQAVQ